MSCIHNHLCDLREVVLVQDTVILLSMVHLGLAFFGGSEYLQESACWRISVIVVKSVPCLDWSICHFMARRLLGQVLFGRYWVSISLIHCNLSLYDRSSWEQKAWLGKFVMMCLQGFLFECNMALDVWSQQIETCSWLPLLQHFTR